MLDISGALSDAFKRTKYLLWERRSFARWWRYALLSILTSGGGGGGISLRLPAQVYQSSRKQTAMLGVMVASGAIGNWNLRLWPFILAGALVGLALGCFFAWLSSCAQFVLIESLVYDRHVLAEPFGRLKSKGTGLFFWTLLVGLVAVVPMLALAGGGAGICLAVGVRSPAVLISVALSCLCLGGMLVLGLGTFFALTQHLVVPIAYRQRIGINPAWALVGQTLKNRKLDCLLFLVCLMGLVLAGGMGVMMGVVLTTGVVAVVGGLVLGIPAVLLYKAAMVIPATVCVVLFALIVIAALFLSSLFFQTPLSIMSRCFGLYVMQQMMPEFGLLPLGGRPEQVVEDEIGPEESHPLGALPEDAWQRPEL